MKAEVTTLASMMEGNEEYVIPYFQRAYAWNQENQWSPLWDDIVNVANAIASADHVDEVPPHFMGPVVIQERSVHPDGRPPGYIVVDGQQRMTTLLIVLQALGDAAEECNQPQLSEQFLSRIWNEIGLSQKTPKVRHTNKRDSLNLREVLNGINSTDSDNRMYECYDFFNSAAVTYIRAGNDPKQRSENLLAALKSKMQTALLVLDASEQPNVVFETLNGRAEPLNPFELVKNTIMYEGQVTEDEQKANALWHLRFEGKWWQEGNMDNFLADWLTARVRRRITVSRVPMEFRAHVQEAKVRGRNIHYVTDRMNRAAKIYEDIHHNEFNETMPASSRLLAMRLSSTLPVILWLWDDDNGVSRRERQACLRLIENYAVRRVIANLSVSDIMTNVMTNNLLPLLGRASDEGESHSRTIAHALKAISIDAARWPTDTEIIQRLCENPHEMSSTRRNVVLEALEAQLRRESGVDPLDGKAHPVALMPGGEIGETNYPIKGSGTAIQRERRERHLKYIGNFTLVRRQLGRRDNNASWFEKLQVLEQSRSIELTKAVLEHNREDWTDQDIIDRSAWMAYLAVRTWPYPEND
jgi:hypothetical protein